MRAPGGGAVQREEALGDGGLRAFSREGNPFSTRLPDRVQSGVKLGHINGRHVGIGADGVSGGYAEFLGPRMEGHVAAYGIDTACVRM
jgi:hypothetical protein